MRYKEYNVNRVLEKSIPLFWKQGFRGCSINDIVKETNVNRFSLYHEFNNKEGILYNSLDYYKNNISSPNLKILEQEGNVSSILKDFYTSYLTENNTIQGCYVIHIGTELADSDPQIKKIVDEYLKEIEQLFINLLVKHQYNDEKAKQLSLHLLGLYCTSMSFCLIHTKDHRDRHIENGIQLILN